MSAYALEARARTTPPVSPPEPDRRVALHERRQPDPATDELRAWARVIRDFALVGIGVFMLVHETVARASPSPLVVGAALVALGLPQAFRLTQQEGDH